MNSECCPCGSERPFDICCGPLIGGRDKACTAEQLMRSRYSAYVNEDVDYLVSTTHPESRSAELADSIAAWMRQVEWIRLHVLHAERDRVEFMAEYMFEGKPARHHEHSQFRKYRGEWFYVGEV